LKKGIVNYTHVANHVPLNARVIGANEHESHYVFDLLYNNTTDIQPSIHSSPGGPVLKCPAVSAIPVAHGSGHSGHGDWDGGRYGNRH
jgi:hypothetical protein